jgi:nicotinamide-nucleotide adenylyltransferase
MTQEQDMRFDTGVIHGRFQVLHNDHLRYLLAGGRLCRHLVVGITNPDPVLTREEKTAPHRSAPGANPMTYYERHLLVKAVLAESRPEGELTVVPFPITMPERYRDYVPMDAVFFLTIYDDWGRKKLDFFESMGLRTFVLWEAPPGEKGISGHDVRKRMISGASWTRLVPPAAARLLEAWRIPDRLRKLNEAAG